MFLVVRGFISVTRSTRVEAKFCEDVLRHDCGLRMNIGARPLAIRNPQSRSRISAVRLSNATPALCGRAGDPWSDNTADDR
jgi:hypothetical protein